MKYDVVIVGAGSAGLAARSEVKKHTENYLVIDDGPLGTTCARVGCMPSKVFIEAANAFHQVSKFPTIGVSGTEHLKVDTQKLMLHVRSLRDRFVRGVLRDIETWKETHFLEGRARLAGPGQLEVNGKTIEAEKIIIATGSKTAMPEAWKELNLLTSDTFFEQASLPESVAVIGAGVIGLELSQALERVGVDVTLFGADSFVAGVTDPDVSVSIKAKISQDLTFVQEAVEKIEKVADGFIVHSSSVSKKVHQVLVCVGRRPQVQNLGFESLNIKLDAKGVPTVDPQTCRIEGTSVYLAGDVLNHLPVLHEAADEGRIAGFNAVHHQDHKFTRRIRMSVAFTHPQICVVGKPFLNLKNDGVEFRTGAVNFEKQGRAIAKMENYGLLKIYAETSSGRLVGAEMFAPDGEHLAHILASAIESGLTVSELLVRPYYHPVIEEGLRTALRDLARQVGSQCSEFDLLRCEDPPAGTFAK